MNPPAMIGAVPGGSSNLKQVKLDRESELRIEVSDEPLRLRVVNGTAEIFGAELPPEIWRTFPPRLKFAVRCGYLSPSVFLNCYQVHSSAFMGWVLYGLCVLFGMKDLSFW